MVSSPVPSGEVAGAQIVAFAAFLAVFETEGVTGFDLPNTNPAPESASSDLYTQVCCISERLASGVHGEPVLSDGEDPKPKDVNEKLNMLSLSWDIGANWVDRS